MQKPKEFCRFCGPNKKHVTSECVNVRAIKSVLKLQDDQEGTAMDRIRRLERDREECDKIIDTQKDDLAHLRETASVQYRLIHCLLDMVEAHKRLGVQGAK